ILALGGSFRSLAADPSADGTSYFEKHIRPVLVERCYQCHSATVDKPKGGLRLDDRAALLRGGNHGPVVVAGKPEKSRLIQAIRRTDAELQMPPKEPLTRAQVAAFEAWVKMGAPDPRVAAAKPQAAIDWEKAKQFWSFRPVRDPTPPAVRHAQWVANEVDRF